MCERQSEALFPLSLERNEEGKESLRLKGSSEMIESVRVCTSDPPGGHVNRRRAW